MTLLRGDDCRSPKLNENEELNKNGNRSHVFFVCIILFTMEISLSKAPGIP